MNTILNKLKSEKKQKTGTLTIRLPKSMLDEIDTICEQNEIQKSALIRELISEGLRAFYNTAAAPTQTKTKVATNLNEKQNELRQEFFKKYNLSGVSANRDAERKLNKIMGKLTNSGYYKFAKLSDDEIIQSHQKLKAQQM